MHGAGKLSYREDTVGLGVKNCCRDMPARHIVDDGTGKTAAQASPGWGRWQSGTAVTRTDPLGSVDVFPQLWEVYGVGSC